MDMMDESKKKNAEALNRILDNAGVGAENEREHYCRYSILRRTIHHQNDEQGFLIRRNWEERCRCGRIKAIDCKFDATEQKSPTRTIRWYDREGNLLRVTGDI